MGYYWLVGVVLVTAASSGSTVGIILMKKSFGDSGEHQTCGDKLVWISGLVMMILGAILDFVAFGFAAQSLIAPLGSVTLLCNVILSPLMLGESVAISDWVASGIIAAGCTVAIAFGDHATKTYEYDDLMDLYDSVGVMIYLPTVFVSVVGLFVGAYRIEKPAFELAEAERRNSISLVSVEIGRNELNPSLEENKSQAGDDGTELKNQMTLPGGFLVDLHGKSVNKELEPLSPTKGSGKDSERSNSSSEGSETELTKKSPESFKEDSDKPVTPQQVLPHIPQKVRLLHGFCKSAAGGLAGSCSVLFGKSVAEIVKPCFTDGDGSGFGKYQTYLVILAMAGTLVVQMKGLNEGLEFHPAVFVVPVYQTFWIMGSIIGGGVYFKEFEGMEALKFAMFATGVCLAITGVYVLTYYRWDAEMAKFEEELGLTKKDAVEVEEQDCTAIGIRPNKPDKDETGADLTIDTRSDSDNSDTDPNAINRSPTGAAAASQLDSEQDIAGSSLSKPPSTLPPIKGVHEQSNPLRAADADTPPSQSKASRAAMRKKRMLRKAAQSGNAGDDH